MVSPWGSLRMKSLTPAELLTAWNAMILGASACLCFAPGWALLGRAHGTPLLKTFENRNLSQLADADLPGWLRISPEKLQNSPDSVGKYAPGWVKEGVRLVAGSGGGALRRRGEWLSVREGIC